jgi:hypothetical protein
MFCDVAFNHLKQNIFPALSCGLLATRLNAKQRIPA